MKLYEYQGMQLFKEYSIPVVPFFVISSLSDLKNKKIKKNLVAKAQVPVGKRGKHGGIVMATSQTIIATCKAMFQKNIQGFPVKKIIVAEKENVQEEWYLAITINRLLKHYTLLFSQHGGIDIEELSQTEPQKILHHSFFSLHDKNLDLFLKKTKISKPLQISLKKIIKNLFHLMQKEDATLVEINPLLLTKNLLLQIQKSLLMTMHFIVIIFLSKMKIKQNSNFKQ